MHSILLHRKLKGARNSREFLVHWLNFRPFYISFFILFPLFISHQRRLWWWYNIKMRSFSFLVVHLSLPSTCEIQRNSTSFQQHHYFVGKYKKMTKKDGNSFQLFWVLNISHDNLSHHDRNWVEKHQQQRAEQKI